MVACLPHGLILALLMMHDWLKSFGLIGFDIIVRLTWIIVY